MVKSMRPGGSPSKFTIGRKVKTPFGKREHSDIVFGCETLAGGKE